MTILSDLRRSKFFILSILIVYPLTLVGSIFWVTKGEAGNPVADYIINGLSGVFKQIRNLIQKTLVQGLGSIVNAVFGGIDTLVKGLLQLFGNIVTGPLRIANTFLSGIGRIGQTIYNGIIHAISSIFVGPVPFGTTHISYVAILIMVVFFVWFGYFIIQSTTEVASILPIAIGNNALDGFGEIFIMLGAIIAIYGTDPQDARLILGGSFFLVLIAGILSAAKSIRG